MNKLSTLRCALEDASATVILTGAGVSVASGLRTYRGPDGLWSQDDQERYSQVETLRRAPAEVWRYFAAMARQAAQTEPNAAHIALAKLEAALRPEQRMLLVTQNIDGLHQRAGSKHVVEYHGSLARPRCSNERCAAPGQPQDWAKDDPPRCTRCGKPQRPDIVLFGESIPIEPQRQVRDALNSCDLFIAIGTSGSVYPAANFVRSAQYAGAQTFYLNIEPASPPNPYFQHELLGPAEMLLSELTEGLSGLT